MHRYLAVPVFSALGVLAAAAGCDQLSSPSGPEEGPRVNRHGDAATTRELAEVRRATAGYQNVRAAEADGYVQFSLHVPGMGVHYLHRSAFDEGGNSVLDASLDRKKPEILVYVDESPESPQKRLVAAEYAVPKGGSSPPQEAVDLFSGAGADDWHVHPSVHELPLSDAWTVHGECHYRGGLGVFLAENPTGDFVLWTPPTGPFGSWSGTVGPEECPTSLGGDPLPPLRIAHGKWWTLHAWVWLENPQGVFHPTNPRVSG